MAAGFLAAAGVSRVEAQFTAVDIGSPTVAGSTAPVAGGFNLSGAGSDIGGTNDQFHFNYQAVTGAFDVKVKVESLSNLDAWSKAGLIARESLTGGSRYAAAFVTPNIGGSFMQARMVNAGATTNIGSFPATYPSAWLRLKRTITGTTNVFTSYAGVDGASWSQLGTVTLVTPAVPRKCSLAWP